MKNLLTFHFSLFALLLLASCTLPQVVVFNPDGSPKIASNGGSVLTKADEDLAALTVADVKMIRRVKKKNEVSVANNYLAKELALGLAESAREVQLVKEKSAGEALVKGTKDPNIIPKDPNVIPADPNLP